MLRLRFAIIGLLNFNHNSNYNTKKLQCQVKVIGKDTTEQVLPNEDTIHLLFAERILGGKDIQLNKIKFSF